MNYIEFRQDWYKKFRHIQYDDDAHKYINANTGKRMTSVTQLIGKFKPEFDTEYWSKKKAKERGITQEAMLKEWNEIKNKGLHIGNTIHDYIEKRYDQYIIEPTNATVEKYMEDTKDDVPYMQEVIVGNDIVAGRFDHLCIRDNKLVIKDWKTNKKFYTTSRYSLINGLDHIPNCEFYIYALQTSLYQYLLDIDISDREIIWFDRQGEYHVFKMPYLENEVKIMLDYEYSKHSH
jgi:hypothetical protein